MPNSGTQEAVGHTIKPWMPLEVITVDRQAKASQLRLLPTSPTTAQRWGNPTNTDPQQEKARSSCDSPDMQTTYLWFIAPQARRSRLG